MYGNAETGFEKYINFQSMPKTDHDAQFGSTWNADTIAVPIFRNQFLSRFLQKLVLDFDDTKDPSCCITMVPVVHNATWWHYTKYFTVIHTYPVGTVLFSCTVSAHVHERWYGRDTELPIT